MTEQESKYYVEQYKQRGFHGSLNFYRTRRVNFDDEIGMEKEISHPALMISALHDKALLTLFDRLEKPPSMAKKMPIFVKNLKQVSVEAAHWAQVEQAERVNAILLEWLPTVV
ncbi:hypothetical protein HDU97_010057 [Phlyctochytrium planicorne]|nr:hypothetical protein HDU97_010057 [Phlyctochytrium planicorne]